jgi:hypothetical protein
MEKVVRGLQMLRTNNKEGASLWPWPQLVIIAVTMFFLTGLLRYQAAAQVSVQSSASQVTVNHPLAPELLSMHARLKRPVPSKPEFLDSASVVSSPNNFNSEQGPGYGPRAGLPGCDLFPAPASIGSKVGLSYFGPPPSTVNPSLVGPVQLLDSGQLYAINGTSPCRCIWAI